jgi:tetratricopeptide (TPR) repeat protein
MTDSWEPAFETPSWDVQIPTDDASITRRRRALAPIQVLTDIERTKGSLDGDYWDRYDLFTIALAVIDQVALAMGISAGRTWEEALDYATAQAARQVPQALASEWLSVAERVLVSLVTTDVQIVKHLVHTESGPAWRNQRFRLLYLHPTGNERVEHLRASEQAINIFVEALDLDIEAAQIANEAQLNALIARGAVESAVEIAKHARYRSIQYQERVRRIVADTLIDPDVHDWIGDVPALLHAALGHVKERLDAESALLDAVSDRRAELDDQTKRDAANQLIEILRECRQRHDDLHRHLIGARSRLREALDDRFSRPPHDVRRYDIGTDLLAPYLARGTATAADAADRMVAIVGGLPARWWPSLTALIEELCAPPQPPQLGDEFHPPEIDADGQPEWWEPYETTVDAVLDGIEQPTRLSQLLARVDQLAAEVDDPDGQQLDRDFLAAAIVHAAHRAWAARLAGRSAGDRVVVAVTTGTKLGCAGIHADDLLLVPGEVLADIDEPAEVSRLPWYAPDEDNIDREATG